MPRMYLSVPREEDEGDQNTSSRAIRTITWDSVPRQGEGFLIDGIHLKVKTVDHDFEAGEVDIGFEPVNRKTITDLIELNSGWEGPAS